MLLLQWDLVCSKTWLVSTISAVFMLGRASGNIIFGYLADRLVNMGIYRLNIVDIGVKHGICTD